MLGFRTVSPVVPDNVTDKSTATDVVTIVVTDVVTQSTESGGYLFVSSDAKTGILNERTNKCRS